MFGSFLLPVFPSILTIVFRTRPSKDFDYVIIGDFEPQQKGDLKVRKGESAGIRSSLYIIHYWRLQ